MAKLTATQKRVELIVQFNKVIIDSVKNQRPIDMVWLSLRCDVHHDGSPAADKIYQDLVSGFMTMLVRDYLVNKEQDGKTIAVWKDTEKMFCNDSLETLIQALGLK